jgi:hypothetical protein
MSEEFWKVSDVPAFNKIMVDLVRLKVNAQGTDAYDEVTGC